jgi:hypothetical protein
VSRFLEWADENWEAVGVVVSIAGALTLAVILLVAFNVVATRPESAPRESARAPMPPAERQFMVAFTP